jgi:hypothetical protein
MTYRPSSLRGSVVGVEPFALSGVHDAGMVVLHPRAHQYSHVPQSQNTLGTSTTSLQSSAHASLTPLPLCSLGMGLQAGLRFALG